MTKLKVVTKAGAAQDAPVSREVANLSGITALLQARAQPEETDLQLPLVLLKLHTGQKVPVDDGTVPLRLVGTRGALANAGHADLYQEVLTRVTAATLLVDEATTALRAANARVSGLQEAAQEELLARAKESRVEATRAWQAACQVAGEELARWAVLPEVVELAKQLRASSGTTFDAKVNALNSVLYLLIRGQKAKVLVDFAKMAELDGRELKAGNPQYGIMDTVSARLYFKNVPFIKQLNDGNSRKVDPVDLWLQLPNRQEVFDMTFRPDVAERVINGKYNLWQGWAVTPKAGPASDVYWELVRTGLCNGNEDYYRYVRRWAAHLVQRPAERPLTALGVSGAQGNGKTAFADVLGAMVRKEHYNSSIRLEDATGRFSAGLAGKLLVFFDDQTWGGDHLAAQHLKRLITADFDRIELKGVDPFELEACKRIIFSSNTSFYYKADSDDRRLLPLEPDNSVINKSNTKFWDEFWKARREGGMVEAVMADLLAEDISSFNPFKDLQALRLDTGSKLAEASMSSMERWLYYSLRDGEFELPIAGQSVRAKEDGTARLPLSTARTSYEHFCSQSSLDRNRVLSLQETKQRDFIRQVLGQPRPVNIAGQGTVRLYDFNWEEAKARLAQLYRFNLTWGDESE